MSSVYERLQAFNESNPLLRERDEVLRKALGELEDYQRLCRVAGTRLGTEVLEAVATLKATKLKEEAAILEHIALENELFDKE